MKAKLKGAETGHSLLKRKSEALTKYVSIYKKSTFNSPDTDTVIADDFEVHSPIPTSP